MTESWYGVRCVFALDGDPADLHAYEERITVWLAPSAEVAIERAEREAHTYAEGIGRYVGLAQSFQLFDVPGDGAEVFSLIRDSALGDEAYLDGFFDTGAERQRHTD